MKNRLSLPVILGAVILLSLFGLIPLQTASAQICYDAQHPNGYPCPKEEKEKKPTIIYPSATFTPTLTSTPTFTTTPSPTFTPSPTSTNTPTITPTPTIIFGMFVSGPAQGLGGFTCPPYAASVPIGAGLMLAGLLTLAARSRTIRSKFEPSASDASGRSSQEAIAQAEAAAERDTSAYPMIQQLVLVIAAFIIAIWSGAQSLILGRSSKINWPGKALRQTLTTPGSTPDEIIAILMQYLKDVSKEARQDKKLTRADQELELSMRAAHVERQSESIDQGMAEAEEKANQAMSAAMASMITGIFSGLLQIAATTLSGMGAGLVMAGFLGGLLGFDCISVQVTLPAGAFMGLFASIIAGLIMKR